MFSISDNIVSKLQAYTGSLIDRQTGSNTATSHARTQSSRAPTGDDNDSTGDHHQLWQNRLDVARSHGAQGRYDEMGSHIKQTGEIIDGTIRYLRFHETKGDDSKDTTYCDELAERGKEVKDAARLLMLRYEQMGLTQEVEEAEGATE